jgi:hypothetical protein
MMREKLFFLTHSRDVRRIQKSLSFFQADAGRFLTHVIPDADPFTFGEEDDHLLPLAFESATSSDNLLDEVFGGVGAWVGGGGRFTASAIRCPHESQNFRPIGFAVPHFGQASASARGVAHSPQNFAPSRFS